MSSNGQREKRRAKRRERKRRGQPRDAAASVLTATPGVDRPRMSQTLVDFAQPLLARLPPEAETAQGWYPELMLASFVWNGVVAGDSPEAIVRRLSRHLSRADLIGVVLELVERKRQQFADDTRSVLGIETYERGDRVHVTALSARE